MQPDLSLDAQRATFCQRRFIAMPLAGTLAWALVGVAGATLSLHDAVLVLYAATGSIFYLGIAISRLTGENLFDRSRPRNVFDRLFLSTVLMSLGVYGIALPFAMQDATSLPLSVGILAGLMWLPFSWIVQHWIGTFHAVARTLLIVAAWYAFPAQRFVVIPAVIVAVYAVTIMVLELRWRRLGRGLQAPAAGWCDAGAPLPASAGR